MTLRGPYSFSKNLKPEPDLKKENDWLSRGLMDISMSLDLKIVQETVPRSTSSDWC